MAYLQQKLKRWLCWNFILRLLLQASLEISFAVLLNIPFLENMFISTSIIEFTDYLMTVLLALCLVAMPFGIVLFYGLLNFNKLDTPSFKQTYGSIYEGLKST